MQMNIAGFLKTSFIDYPGKISSVFFTSGCNFRCLYCHNWQIISSSESSSEQLEEAFKWLEEKKNLIDGIVVTGGEPCLQKDLISFLERLRKMRFKIKLDSNGYFPKVLKEVIEKKLVDYIAMDMKAPFSKYKEIVGIDLDVSKLKESVKLIMDSGLDYEFRTTAYPSLTKEDYKEISKQIKGAKKYYIQQFRTDNIPKDCISKPLSLSELEKFCSIVRSNGIECGLRY